MRPSRIEWIFGVLAPAIVLGPYGFGVGRQGAALALFALLPALPSPAAPAELRFTFIGNMAFHVTDGSTVLLTDFPYESGASGYMRWQAAQVPPVNGPALALITHSHRDHFAGALLAPYAVTVAGPADVLRVVKDKPREALAAGRPLRFHGLEVEPRRTGHAGLEHYSYLVTWQGLRLYFTGDTEDPSDLLAARDLDVACVSPWLLAAVKGKGARIDARRVVVYHHQDVERVPEYQDRLVPRQGEGFTVPARLPSVQERLGHPRESRLLVLHGDDVGMAHSVNRASFEALRRGFITSASILVPCPWFPEVAAFARANPGLDWGIHLALNSEWKAFRWGPVSGADAVPSLVDEQGYLPLLQRPVAEKASLEAVEHELRAQVERARREGIPLTHLDTHMGTLGFSPGLFRIYQRLGRELGLPILQDRSSTERLEVPVPADEILVDRILGLEKSVDAAAWRGAYEGLLRPLPPGVYELIVHLAHDDEEMRGAAGGIDFGSEWRQNDYDLVRDPAFARFLADEKFVLVTWGALAKALPADYARRR